MKQLYIFCFITLGCLFKLNAQVGINTTTPNASSVLDITSTNQGILIPRMTSGQRTSISPSAIAAKGLLVYQTDAPAGFYYWDGAAWQTFGGGGSGWALTGDGGTTAGPNFVGTTDAQGMAINTAGLERVRIDATGLVGLGTTTPTEELHMAGTAPVFRFQDGNEVLNAVLTSDANGDVSWAPPVASAPDTDWAFLSGSGFSDPVYHQGGVVIGRTGAPSITPTSAIPASTPYHLSIDNSAGTTTVGVGDVEYIQEGNNEFMMSHSLVKHTGSFSDAYLGVDTSTFPFVNTRWNTLYTQNPVNASSDRKLKKDIKELDYGLEELMKLRPVAYKWKEATVGSVSIPLDERELKFGLVGQEVEKVIPEVVGTHSLKKSKSNSDKLEYTKKEILSMNYAALLPLLVKAKQEQHKQLFKLQKENNALLKQVTKLNNKQN
jgi:hypothetical protein